VTTTIIGVNDYEGIVHAFNLDQLTESDALARYFQRKGFDTVEYDAFYSWEDGEFREVEFGLTLMNAWDKDRDLSEYRAKVYGYSGELLHEFTFTRDGRA
jgi:hypothetical protein